MKKVYNNPVTEVTLLNACSVLCASGDSSSAPKLHVSETTDSSEKVY